MDTRPRGDEFTDGLRDAGGLPNFWRRTSVPAVRFIHAMGDVDSRGALPAVCSIRAPRISAGSPRCPIGSS